MKVEKAGKLAHHQANNILAQALLKNNITMNI